MICDQNDHEKMGLKKHYLRLSDIDIVDIWKKSQDIINVLQHLVSSLNRVWTMIKFEVKQMNFSKKNFRINFFNRHYSLLSGPQLYNLEAFSFAYSQYVVLESADKLYNCVTVFLCFTKVCLSHRLQAGTQHGLGALQHSLWPNI